ncbi:cysteine desulfurase family protein [Mycolicibacterium peregrinum]|uniref:Cysteine desulfurase n=1 Tax=Mycolicibacterium peregrinum TaxID=43304 RepID=A0A4Z0HUN3_MYCPR|nr:cysteine desulfurase family protein [Mycolicibacterium peregrinum]TGB44645.1 cysteine desulfurase [Mycolicibacterium peregrinum]TGB46944.1 cysteine desulfurase [Mycolicibacterium peregrinum]
MVYLDYNASTPIDQRVLGAAVEALDVYGNPASSHHVVGQMAAELVNEARSRVAVSLGRSTQEVMFTSGATEAAVLGLLGVMLGSSSRPNIVVSPTEHKAVLEAAELGARLAGGEVRVVRVDRDGVVDVDDLDRLVDDSVAAVAVMAANNETGVIAPATAIADIAERVGALVFVDATQLLGKGSLDGVVALADVMVFSSHKIYGPKGAGALVASRSVQKLIVPIASGGGQERGFRGGTQNTPAIVGFGLAAELAMKEQASDAARIRDLANELLVGLRRKLPDVHVNGGEADRLPNTLNLRFVGADSEAVMASMPEICVSAGSACNSAVPSPSHVLLAMGMSGTEASESLRISLGRPTTRDEIDVAVTAISAAVSRVRELTGE